MNLTFRTFLASQYTSVPQKVRVLSEDWMSREVYCPSCGEISIKRQPNNKQVCDFICHVCNEHYELKSQSRSFHKNVTDGEYHTMMRRLAASTNPNLFLLQYDKSDFSVVSLCVVPKQFFVPSMIHARKPLSQSARRKGWTGCTISLQDDPQSGMINLISNRLIELKPTVLSIWQRTQFLRHTTNTETRRWLVAVMRCIERLDKPVFSLTELYLFDRYLSGIFPENHHVRPKMRQQLQVLRDAGYLEFLGKGTYRVTKMAPQ